MYKCKICGKEYENRYQYSGHYRKHSKSENYKNKWNEKKYTIVKCPVCEKEYSNMGIGTHIWRAHTEKGKNFDPNRGYKNGTISAWNKGLTKETDERVAKLCKTRQIHYDIGMFTGSFTGKCHSEETKKKISASLTKYLLDYPDNVPYLRNHSSKPSYPEKIMMNALSASVIEGWEYKYQNSIYQYDFAIPDLKIDIEVDGGTHRQEKVIAIDERRDKFSRDNGWVVLRFEAKEVKENILGCINQIAITSSSLL